MSSESDLAANLFGLQQLNKLLHHWKSHLFQGLISGEKCVLKLVIGSQDVDLIDAASSAIAGACNEHLQICKLETEGLSDLPIYMAPVIPVSHEKFVGSAAEAFLKKQGLGFDVLVFLDDVQEVIGLSEQSHVDPNFAARIDLIYTGGPPPTTAAATPTAGSCGLHVSWGAFTLLEKLGLLVPSRCGPAIFMGEIYGTNGRELALKDCLTLARDAMLELTRQLDAKLEAVLWNRTDNDLVEAIGAILKGTPTVRAAA
mmetsp:Transcript_6693/g.11932  ORF Transcript_6693/g.11932 Transcript_6693/m.11932 type:complete len:257 (+) Transcript_6693:44-814(+)